MKLRDDVKPLAPADLKDLKITYWDVKRKEKKYEYLGGLVEQKHTVLNCSVANVATTIVARVLKYQLPDGTLEDLLEPDWKKVEALGKVITDLTKHAPHSQPMSREAYAASQGTARKVRRMEEALASLRLEPIQREDSELRAFGKREKLKFGKPLRIIQARGDRYLMDLGRRIKPLEKGLYASINEAFGYVVVMKGLNGVQRGQCVWEMWDEIPNPVAISVDLSKFDASTHKWVLQQEHKAYTQCAPGDTTLAKLLRWQLKNKGRAVCEDGVIKYGRSGGRMSGDANTSLGNIVICTAAHKLYAEEQGIPFRLANDGDDSVIIVSEKHARRYTQGLQAFWEALGYHIRVDGITREFSEIDFCQSRPVNVAGLWTFVRNPSNAIQKDLLNPSCPRDSTERAAWYHAVGSGGLTQGACLPMYSAFYAMLKRMGKANKINYQWRAAMEKSAKYTRTGLVGTLVEEGTRVSFYQAFGIPPWRQAQFEDACNNFEFNPIPDQQAFQGLLTITYTLISEW